MSKSLLKLLNLNTRTKADCFAQTVRLDYRVAELKRQQEFICDYRFIQISLFGLQLSMTSFITVFDGTEK